MVTTKTSGGTVQPSLAPEPVGEAPSESDQHRAATLAEGFGGIGGGLILQCCAIVAALSERGLVDPMRVAEWADFFAENHGRKLHPTLRDMVACQAQLFAQLLRDMHTRPPGAGTA